MDLQERANYWASQYGVDEDTYARLVNQESSWNPSARNASSGAYGLTQVMPATARDPGFGVKPLTNPNDPDEQLRFGAEYMGMLLKRYGGDEAKAAAAYNWGPGNADNWSGDPSALPAETANYVNVVAGGGGGGGGGGAGGQPAQTAGLAEPEPAPPEMVDPDWEAPTETGLGGLMPSREFTNPNTGEEGKIYADNMLGRAAKGNDAFKKRWGITEEGGAEMMELGQRMMMGQY